MVYTENKDIISHTERGIMTTYLIELKLSIEEMTNVNPPFCYEVKNDQNWLCNYN